MSPELERLLEAYYEKRTCPREERAQRAATFRRLLAEAVSRKPGVSQDEILNALAERYGELRRQRIKVQRERLSRLQ